jgi:hypothetical protein
MHEFQTTHRSKYSGQRIQAVVLACDISESGKERPVVTFMTKCGNYFVKTWDEFSDEFIPVEMYSEDSRVNRHGY